MKNKTLTISIIFPAVLLFFIEPALSQSFSENKYCFTSESRYFNGVSFKKALLGRQTTAEDSISQYDTTKTDSEQQKKSINMGRIAGFATIGFLSGLFFGATMEQTGDFSGPGFHLEPALIGAGIGVAAAFIIPENWGKKKKEGQ